MVLDIAPYFHLPTLLMDMFSYFTDCIIAFFSVFLPVKFVNNLKIFLLTLPRDFRCLVASIAILVKAYYERITNQTTLTVFDKLVKKCPKKPCLLFEGKVWTFQDVDDYSNKVAHVFYLAGFRKGDVVALMMINRPEYVGIWLGLARLGVITALINTNLRSQSLTHSISIVKSKAVIFSNEYNAAIEEIKSNLLSEMKFYAWGDEIEEGHINLKNKISSATFKKFIAPYVLKHHDHIVYIYTSGTTGLPKAAIIPHSRLLNLGLLIIHLLDIRPEDIIYDPLPLYHTVGGMLGIGASLLVGSTTVIRRSFSASSYIPDCIKYNCTVGQYIGEVCRYLLSVPPKPEDKAHSLRVVVGNGLKPAIWTKFVERFGIPRVMEVYGSTEGNLQFANIDGKVGAVGFIPRFLPFSHYIGAIIKVDLENDKILRNSDGLCIPCETGEPGMFVGLIPSKNSVKEVHGYVDKKESNKKIIRDVFKKGDRAFLSGDIVVMDEMGYLYFKDRTGDTFRWKGENVATTEVEAVISNLIDLRDCIVYGVEVSNLEGRIGMAAIVDPKREINLQEFAQALDKSLPKFAHPFFLRILPEAEMTGTFKLKKFNLQREGFDPNLIKDPLYFRKGCTYVTLTKELYDQILNGEIRL